MKKTGKIVITAMLAAFFLSFSAGAQEKKEQQKIKIVVADNSGTKVLIDTAFAGSPTPDSITLKDGNVIYIKREYSDIGGHDNANNVSYTVTGDNRGDRKIRKEITAIARDSAGIDTKADGKNVIVMSDGKAIAGTSYNVSVNSDSKNEGKSGNKTVYYFVSSGKGGHKGPPEKFDLEINSDEPNAKDNEKSSYVIARDGIVVTIEGGSEEQVKELASVIETKLGVKKDSKTGKK